MAVATFDTLKFANTLKAAGVPPQQAEARAVAFAEVVQLNFKELATKEDVVAARADLERVAAELRAEMERIAKEAKDNLDQAVKELKRDGADQRTELKHDMQTMQAKHQADILLLKWMLGATFTGVVAGLGLLGRLLFVLGR